MRVVISSGYYNPLHIGHIRYLKAAKELGDFHITIVSNDDQVKAKGSIPFMPAEERLEVVKELRSVSRAILAVDKLHTVKKTLRHIRADHPSDELIFANGGDVIEVPNERPTCEELGIRLVFNVGGGKIQSSSSLIEGAG